MNRISKLFTNFTHAVAAAMVAVMFLTFLLQIFVRYTAQLPWLAEMFPFIEPSRYGWTLEFCLFLWVWLVFWGNAFVVRQTDHVTFDILYNSVQPKVRRIFFVAFCLIIAFGLLASLEPTWSKFYVLRLKKTATLSSLFGDWVRMRDIYVVYAFFLVAVPLRFGWLAYRAIRYGMEDPAITGPINLDEANTELTSQAMDLTSK
jgi:C4-dicarboxylate transporter DctQ subunit